MTAGAKTELVSFEREENSRRPGGGMNSGWSVIGQAWAKVEWIGGSEGERAGAVRAVSKYRVTVYAAAVEALALTPSDRIVWGAERLNIRERPRAVIAKPDIEIIAESGVTN